MPDPIATHTTAVAEIVDFDGAVQGLVCVHTDGSLAVISNDDYYSGRVLRGDVKRLFEALREAFQADA